ncbi:hypothetical protein SAMN05421736_103343 [Evansella caseinilytica]|uniref:Uncharacterized protein n=1 Tax=Evansella caseinilytica TaxID=1503961 RepID=A0A1H3MUY1_9BACI|nr:hypothetical protein [Evansella caseinilytica]SDY80260.1 hypothetical protein SAMN05421736_103343 [Evansella caseinilytica]
MKKKQFFCNFDRGKANVPREKTLQIAVRSKSFSSPQEYRDFLTKLQISSRFEMRYRGLFEFYGDDLIAYSLKNSSDKNSNEFLRIFSSYLTDYLEDRCPSSWKQCHPPFWEELMLTYYPHCMKLTTYEKEVDNFSLQLKQFVLWLDKRVDTSWYNVICQYADEFLPDLRACEHLLNSLYLNDFPNLHHDDFIPEQEIGKFSQNIDKYTERVASLFQVIRVIENITLAVDLHSGQTYSIQGLPAKNIVPGMLMYGDIGKNIREKFWHWYCTEGVYPQNARKYFTFAD